MSIYDLECRIISLQHQISVYEEKIVRNKAMIGRLTNAYDTMAVYKTSTYSNLADKNSIYSDMRLVDTNKVKSISGSLLSRVSPATVSSVISELDGIRGNLAAAISKLEQDNRLLLSNIRSCESEIQSCRNEIIDIENREREERIRQEKEREEKLLLEKLQNNGKKVK